MFDIYDTRVVRRTVPVTVPGIEHLIRVLNQDIEGYRDWRNTDVTSVPPDHLLVSLLLNLSQRVGYNPEYTVDDLFRRSYYLMPDMASVFGFAYSTNAGRLHVGDSGNLTLYVLGESPLRKDVTVSTPYRKIIPLRYLSHDSTNLTMGSEADSEDLIGLGFDIIEIDMGLLVLQYYQWIKEQLSWADPDKRPLGSFVSMYVLPSLKFSQYALAFMNRMTALALEYPVSEVYHRTSRPFPDRTRLADDYLSQLVGAILKKECKFEYLLEGVPVPGPWASLGDAHTLPDMPVTRQVGWAMACARFNLVFYLFTMVQMDKAVAQRYPVNGIRRVFQRLVNDNAFTQALRGKEAQSVKEKFEMILAESA